METTQETVQVALDAIMDGSDDELVAWAWLILADLLSPVRMRSGYGTIWPSLSSTGSSSLVSSRMLGGGMPRSQSMSKWPMSFSMSGAVSLSSRKFTRTRSTSGGIK